MKLENFDEVYEIAEVHLENENVYIFEEEIGEEQNELEIQVETMEIINSEPEQVKEETSESWNNYPWICPRCPIIFPSSPNLKDHYSTEHKGCECLKYTCADCSKVVDKYYAFINHIKSRHREYLLLSCDLCNKNFKSIQELADHRSAHMEGNESTESLVLCSTCGKAFRNQNALQIHANCHQPDDVKYKFTCNVCDKKFGSKPNLKAHQKIHAGKMKTH